MKRTLRLTRIGVVLLFASGFNGAVFFATGQSRADPPDFSICDGLSGAAWGLCRGGVAAGCADMTGNPTACMHIEDNYAAVTGETAPWLAPPLPPCPCNFDEVPKTVIEWTTATFGVFAEVLYQCPAGGVFPGATFAAWDGSELSVGAQIDTTGGGVDSCSWARIDFTGDAEFGLTTDELQACRLDVIDYAAEFIALNPGVPVNDQCTPTL